MFGDVYADKKVIVTGNTGFKGSWLAFWLLQLGSRVTGYALPPPTKPNHFELLKSRCEWEEGDITDLDSLVALFESNEPDFVFHLAAQPLVRESYRQPVDTFGTNVMGTVNVLEACRRVGSVKALVVVTSDKCYEDKGWHWGYRETDALGGHDPYSASKGCAELVSASYAKAFFPLEGLGKNHNTLVATARAGNVIGGGDWGADRLIPDVMRAVAGASKVSIRSPDAVRPWQHVLDPLSGYLLLGQRLWQGERAYAGPWNFGPYEEGQRTVEEVVGELRKAWPIIEYEVSKSCDQPHETAQLRLDSSRARSLMGWRPVWSGERMFRETCTWYREYLTNGEVVTAQQLQRYQEDAGQLHLHWAIS